MQTFTTFTIAVLLCIAAAFENRNPVDTNGKSIETLAKDRGGQQLVGRAMPDLQFDRWLALDDTVAGDADDDVPQDRPAVTLYRWWTNGCPYCESSLPAIEAWRKKYGPHGLRTVAVYHPKPPREVSDDFVRGAAEEFGYYGPITIDADWSQLDHATHGWRDRRATSVSFLVDHQGVIRFVHPGVDYFPSDDPDHAQQNRDHELIEQAIRILLERL